MELAGEGSEETAETEDESAHHGGEAGGLALADRHRHRGHKQRDTGGQSAQSTCRTWVSMSQVKSSRLFETSLKRNSVDSTALISTDRLFASSARLLAACFVTECGMEVRLGLYTYEDIRHCHSADTAHVHTAGQTGVENAGTVA